MITPARDYRPARSGLTLLELTLVLALVVVLVAMAAPQLTRVRASSRLRAGGDQLRTAWAKTRNQAMRDGIAQAFIYLPEARLFAIAPTEPTGLNPTVYQTVLQHLQQLAMADQAGEHVVLEPLYVPGLPTAATTATGTNANVYGVPISPPAVRFERLPEELVVSATAPDGVTPVITPPMFSTVMSPGMLPGATGTTNSMQMTAPLGLSGGQGAGAILFLPDGTSQDATVWLRNVDGEMMAVNLRGLTGMATTGSVIRTQLVATGGMAP